MIDRRRLRKAEMTQVDGGPPQPGGMNGPIEFVAALRELRLWSGLTFRQLAAKARVVGEQLPASTIASALSRTSLPRREVVVAFARACGLDQTSVAEWVAVRDGLAARAASGGQGPVASQDVPQLEQAVPETWAGAWLAPAMLPPDIPDFTGRRAQVAALRKQLTAVPSGDRQPAVLVVATIVGMGGVGKTALALHVAHLVAESYPDGQLWVNLRGAEASPLEPGDVLARFLRALGMPDRAIPTDTAERAGVYRTLLAGRRVLVLLDNAAAEEQIRPLLPGAATCAVVVTSRIRLTGIEGAQRIDLEVFTPREAIRLLARVTDDERVCTQAAEAAEIVKLCGDLPLAVRIAGARLAARPGWRLAHLAAMLRDERRRLDRLATGDLAVRASLALSYRGLGGQSRRLFRLLGLFNVPDFPAWLAAIVLECSLEQATEHAEALVDAQLLTVAGTDAVVQYRYRFHDLVRLFAFECALAEEPGTERGRVLSRGLGGWLALAERMAARIPGPCSAPISGSVPRPPIDWAEEYTLRVEPEDWFDAERAALLSAGRQARRLGLDDLAFALAGCLAKYFGLRGRYTDWASINAGAMAVCRSTGNLLGEAVMLRGLIDVMTWITDGRNGDAMARLHAEAFRLLGRFTELRPEKGTADAAVMSAWSLTATGAHVDAVTVATGALEQAGELGNAWCEALERRRGDPHVRTTAETSLVLSSGYNMSHHLAEVFEVLADGCPDRAIAYLEESVALWRTRGWHCFQAAALIGLGRVYTGVDGQAAQKAFSEAQALFTQLGDTSKAAELKRLGDTLAGC